MPVDPALARRLVTAGRKAKEWPAERDRLIVEAVAAGAGVREVARLVDLTHPGVLRILKKEGASSAHAPDDHGSATDT